MKGIYDRKSDTFTITFTEAPIVESDEEKPGMIVDYDAAGNLVSMEILDASRRVSVPGRVVY